MYHVIVYSTMCSEFESFKNFNIRVNCLRRYLYIIIIINLEDENII